MSEYQFVHFLARDRPLDDKQLEYMGRQSSRAEITPWEFTSEYHWGDFHGDAEGMLRRGYDVHLRYANFGVRRLMIRLPAGLPCDRKTFAAFRGEGGVEWLADKKGKGGILAIEPEADAGTYDDMYDAESALAAIAPVREELIGGDLRALYVAWLATNFDGESLEPPVPAGLGKLTPALEAMADFYEVGDDLLAAAAERSPALPGGSRGSPHPAADDSLGAWIAGQSKDDLQQLVRRLLGNDATATRAETLARIRDESGKASWPLVEPTRTLAELRELADAQGDKRESREKQAEEAKRRKRLAAISANPAKAIKSIERLAGERSVASYKQAAEELADLRDALGPDAGAEQARAIAEKLRRANPRRGHLAAALRRQGLLD